MSSAHPRVPVRLQTWEESLRRCAEPINYLLDRLATQSKMLNPNVTGLSIPAASPGTIIAPYDGPAISTAYADFDLTTGIITVQEAGLYTVNAGIAFDGPGAADAGEQYILEVVFTLGGTPSRSIVGAYDWGNKTVAGSISGVRSVAMEIGDSCALAMYATTADTINILGGEFTLLQNT